MNLHPRKAMPLARPILLMGLFLAAACSSEQYLEEADQEVYRIIEDKQGVVLGKSDPFAIEKGEKVEVLARLRVVSVRREPLNSITQADVNREGFPHLNTMQFIEMFMKHMGLRSRDTPVTRIEFEYLDD